MKNTKKCIVEAKRQERNSTIEISISITFQ